MSWDLVVQLWIAAGQGTAMWLTARTDRWSRWGFPLALSIQPGYFYATWKAEQWGMFILTAWLTYSFAMGTYNRFWRKYDDQRTRS